MLYYFNEIKWPLTKRIGWHSEALPEQVHLCGAFDFGSAVIDMAYTLAFACRIVSSIVGFMSGHITVGIFIIG